MRVNKLLASQNKRVEDVINQYIDNTKACLPYLSVQHATSKQKSGVSENSRRPMFTEGKEKTTIFRLCYIFQ